jgi:hypothetical protein
MLRDSTQSFGPSGPPIVDEALPNKKARKRMVPLFALKDHLVTHNP